MILISQIGLYVYNLSILALKESRRSFVASLKAMTNNEDKTIEKTSKQVCDFDGYGLDIIDF